ncbi:galactocerebrosidase [Plakobranchus ocellatus]|uniref:galactosylceramidase n=1 Tax=Plakobranchus ocellatus TaxID=259542 RepID=A0AAV4AD39_9GAST|nr:galactocerebrosidase [Plakobranchus ocellatus]
MDSFNALAVVFILQVVALAFVYNTKHSSPYVRAYSIHDQPETLVFDDTQGLGREFEGIGAISGGGATSKLLVNYPEKQRNEILDYLFKPNFGASLQIFKVEIGGDMQSTDGTEASHMHNQWDENYSRGYEWWLLQEAKKRNPNIKLYCLPWGFPGWIGQGTTNPFVNPKQTADYVVRWISAAKTQYNLTMDFVGIWNERMYSIPYIKTLRKMLDDRGFHKTLIIAADKKWEIATDISKDEDLASAVHAIGCHYPGTYSSAPAKKTGKPLWASEDYSTFNNEVGGGCWARILNQNYVNGEMTSTISWNLIGSYYPQLPFFRDGLMTATQPWSGHYVVNTPIWMTAHTTQFVPIGWQYLAQGYGVGKLPKGGSYVSLSNPSFDQLTIVIETMTHNHSKCIRPNLPYYTVQPQTVKLKLQGSFIKIEKMNVWYSKLGLDGSTQQMFIKKQDLFFQNNEAELKLGLDEVITLTTVDSGRKGSHPDPPVAQPFPQVVADNFSGYVEHQEPNYLAPQIGSLEVQEINGERVARQTVLERPVYWCKAEKAEKTISIIGNHSWTDMNVSVSFSIPSVNGTTGVFVATRVDRGGCDSLHAKGIFFYVFPQDDQFIVSGDLARTHIMTKGKIRLESGKHTISLEVSEGKAVGQVDQTQLFSVAVAGSSTNGWGAIGTDTFGYADFDDFLFKGPQALKFRTLW